MKKTRFIPYGYTVCNGHLVVEREEAAVIQAIFTEYVNGASLKELADNLSNSKVPYTERTCVWDKARIARIIDNSKYLGIDDYDPIIDEGTFEAAATVKNARSRNKVTCECEGIITIRNHIRCACCGAPMVRRVCSKKKIKESWVCTSDACAQRVRISDTELLQRITLLINRIVENGNLMIPRKQEPYTDSSQVAHLQDEIKKEMNQKQPNEERIINMVSEIASQLYAESNATSAIAAHIVRKRTSMMRPQDEFNIEYFADLIKTVELGADGAITLITKTGTKVKERTDLDGSTENP